MWFAKKILFANNLSVSNTWMPLQNPSIDCPCGLEFLKVVDQVMCYKVG